MLTTRMEGLIQSYLEEANKEATEATATGSPEGGASPTSAESEGATPTPTPSVSGPVSAPEADASTPVDPAVGAGNVSPDTARGTEAAEGDAAETGGGRSVSATVSASSMASGPGPLADTGGAPEAPGVVAPASVQPRMASVTSASTMAPLENAGDFSRLTGDILRGMQAVAAEPGAPAHIHHWIVNLNQAVQAFE